MGWNVDKMRRGLLAVLLLVNLFAPLQKVLACATLDAQSMPMMAMACCPEAVSLGDDRYADIERQILNGDSCCVVTVESTAQDASIQHHQYAESALKQVVQIQWLLLPVLLNALPPQDDGGSRVSSPPADPGLAALGGTETYATTARLRI